MSASNPMLRPDPSPALVASFRAAAARMAGLGLVNPALAVEAIGFAVRDGRWIGVLVTPWCMNLVAAPCDPRAWPTVAPGAKVRLTFPAGDFEFVGAHDGAAGEYLACSLFSPVFEFADQVTARAVAEQALVALLDAGTAHESGPIERRIEAPLTRRDLLRGSFLRGDDGARG
ncbi:MAG: [NiFe]-hydrogenase assembly chaperone HybE [Burkholderiales bacterium]|nr:[NiFe]-hydrogenase assembly chaperone HybE [Burkholderiales bacterium]